MIIPKQTTAEPCIVKSALYSLIPLKPRWRENHPKWWEGFDDSVSAFFNGFKWIVPEWIAHLPSRVCWSDTCLQRHLHHVFQKPFYHLSIGTGSKAGLPLCYCSFHQDPHEMSSFGRNNFCLKERAETSDRKGNLFDNESNITRPTTVAGSAEGRKAQLIISLLILFCLRGNVITYFFSSH